MTLALLVGIVIGLLAGSSWRRPGVPRSWLLANAAALARKGELYGAALIRELAEGKAVVCIHRLDAGECPHCRAERKEAVDAV